ncbi:helix-turn-helix domain-containing protein [Negadavirga shengliensis]|uniref:Helix-turn-helix domain-containing protein n=2 Tax=Negadavirga shengliensis TaxID=1389218 RepID=A0ABV9T8Y8_9BACT
MTTNDFRVSGLNRIFKEEDLLEIGQNHVRVLGILSYFATSLFDKSSTEEVLWDITENCISQLGLEDCVVYLLDKKQEKLIQKATFGNKNLGKRSIYNPIVIPYGKGIVGTVAMTGKPLKIGDVRLDKRYILDDMQRQSELAVPIFLDGKVIGVIDSEHSETAFYTDHHLYLFELIAELTAKKLRHILNRNKTPFTNDNVYYRQFLHLIGEEKLYRDEQLSLNDVANRLHISANYLSQLVNVLGKTSFPELINRFRIEEAARCLRHRDFAHYTVESIGYEVGFRSRSSFYSAFRKQTGMSPAQWRKTSSS